MAGIGFALRKLSQEKTFTATFRAYIHAALAAAGPWLITILTIGGITLITYQVGQKEVLYEFRLLLVYNFSFSLVLASPVFLISTRYLADKLYIKDLKSAPGLIIFTLAFLYLILLPVALFFYGKLATLEPQVFLGALINLFIITALWLVSLFISIIQDFKTVSWAYLIGGTFALIAAWVLVKDYGTAGLLFGFTAGLSITLGILISQILSEYNFEFKIPQNFFHYFQKYWQLALGAFIYNTAAWIDKWIMWFSPHAQVSKSGLRFFDTYDSAMFLCQLTIIPSMAMFLLTVETGFFEGCRKFYGDIIHKVTYDQIERNQQKLIEILQKSARNTFILQGGITFLMIVFAPSLFSFFNLNYLQMGIFRLGALGAFFHIMSLFIMTLLTYFDSRQEPLIISFVFLITNGVFTTLCIKFGFQFYGYGYFLSSLVTFTVAVVILIKIIQNLPYVSFIKNNQSVQNSTVVKPMVQSAK